MSAAKINPISARPATLPTEPAAPRVGATTPARAAASELLRTSPFPGAEDDAEDDAAALARATERANRLLGRRDAPRDVAYLRTLAWDRHCKGVATADIADEFDVPERTVRSWIAAIRDELAGDLAELRQTHLLLAVASLRSLLATTWELLEVERDATLPLLESLAVTAGARQEAARARPSQAPRYILAALAIQKELDRLLALNVTALAPIAPVENPAETATPPIETQPEKAAGTASASVPPRPAGRGGVPRQGLVPGERGLEEGEEPQPSPAESAEASPIPSPSTPVPSADDLDRLLAAYARLADGTDAATPK
jgi:hypothetical protein